eukprot:1156891-Prymnesium_polylepis.1
MPCWGCGGEISSGVGVTHRGRILHAASPDCERAADEKPELRRIEALAAEHEAWASSPAPVSKGSRVSGYSPFEPKWARCVRADCPCTASYNGLAGEHCGLTCQSGQACARNFHRVPREQPKEAAVCQPSDEPPWAGCGRAESSDEPPWAGCVRTDCPCTA